MREAKYYIYRNLRTKGFSIRYKGKVIDRLNTFIAHGVEFKVNEKGRQRVLDEKQKNVHAFVVADKYTKELYPIIKWPTDIDDRLLIKYNPYRDTQFICNGLEIDNAKKVIFQNGLCILGL